jgi:hypothetical protein
MGIRAFSFQLKLTAKAKANTGVSPLRPGAFGRDDGILRRTELLRLQLAGVGTGAIEAAPEQAAD